MALAATDCFVANSTGIKYVSDTLYTILKRLTVKMIYKYNKNMISKYNSFT